MMVLDASAVLAWLQNEAGAKRVDQALYDGATINTVSWAEVLSTLAGKGMAANEVIRQLAERGILYQLLTVDAGQPEDAAAVGDFYPVTRSAGLSLGDRYCLALGQRLGATVLTTDRAWAALQLSITVELAR